MSQKIVHQGIVDSLSDEGVRVRIVQSAACGSCKVASQCHISEQKTKLVDVRMAQSADGLKVGDAVRVAATTQMGMKAVVLAFVLPFLLMVGVVFVVSLFTRDEPLMALCGLVSLIPYYIIIYACRKKISEKIAFEIVNT